jgi:hypothetical protein
MYIVLCTSSNRPFILSLIHAIKGYFPHMSFVLHDNDNNELQLRLLGTALEDRPETYIRGFTAAWEIMERLQNSNEK